MGEAMSRQRTDEEEAGLFRPTLASHLRPGETVKDPNRGGRERTVTRVETFHRVHVEPLDGEPDAIDFPAFGPDARPLARPGPARHRPRPLRIEPTGFEDDPRDALLEASWEATDLRGTGG
jgi:hypothetical protein